MIIGDRFVWAHLPKAAGTATQEMIASVPGLVRFQVPIDSNDKHAPFWMHGEAIEGKLRAMNIRRLPSWLLSIAHHRSALGVHPDYVPLQLPSDAEIAGSGEADEMISWMTRRTPVDRWLRMESLSADVEALLVELGTDARTARKAIATVPYVAKDYDHDIRNRFTPEQLREMYEGNPTWTGVEMAVYGSIIAP